MSGNPMPSGGRPQEDDMHIEEGVVTGAKLIPGYATAATAGDAR